jgi:cyanophycin synthetase
MKKVIVDENLIKTLNDFSLNLDSIIQKGKKVFLSNLANISQGGSAEDVTSIIHKDNIVLAQRAAQAIGLDIAGVDFISKDISKSWFKNGGAVIEVNAQPGFRPHWLASPEKDVIFEIVKESFDELDSNLLITLFIGKSAPLTAAMTREIWRANNKNVGLSTSQGVWVNDDLIYEADSDKYKSVRTLFGERNLDVCLAEVDLRTINEYGYPCASFDAISISHGQISSIKNCNQETKEIYEDGLIRSKAIFIFVEDFIKMKKLNFDFDESKVILLNIGRGNRYQIGHELNGGKTVKLEFVNGEAWVEFSEGATNKLLSKITKINLTNKIDDIKDQAFARALLMSVSIAWASSIDQTVISNAVSNCVKMKA